jgi:hypothetical protein
VNATGPRPVKSPDLIGNGRERAEGNGIRGDLLVAGRFFRQGTVFPGPTP